MDEVDQPHQPGIFMPDLAPFFLTVGRVGLSRRFSVPAKFRRQHQPLTAELGREGSGATAMSQFTHRAQLSRA